jgi:hypothetical protein
MADENNDTGFKERRIGMADVYGTTAEVDLMEDEGGEGGILLRLHCGQCGARAYPTPEAARQLAGALMDVAEAAEQ